MSTATFTPGAGTGRAAARTTTNTDRAHTGATAVSDKPHRVARAVRAVRIFLGAAVGVVLLGDYADDWKRDVRAGRGEGGDWRYERDAWAAGQHGTSPHPHH
ncbi:hypothetical protein OG897_03125 [Streptomyces sp. NBC_00237]|uniref:hypothetical protein n=1 Tax=Streptomyces sp. NBC_00237 TaxID=2975687 RepID=UPI00224C80C4|nr:hypothetical protein [Streptomyces sp. NBC_00237]MCX5200457.1 hypothetical protein [Streptomyces sp. NBC_00237]